MRGRCLIETFGGVDESSFGHSSGQSECFQCNSHEV